MKNKNALGMEILCILGGLVLAAAILFFTH